MSFHREDRLFMCGYLISSGKTVFRRWECIFFFFSSETRENCFLINASNRIKLARTESNIRFEQKDGKIGASELKLENHQKEKPFLSPSSQPTFESILMTGVFTLSSPDPNRSDSATRLRFRDMLASARFPTLNFLHLGRCLHPERQKRRAPIHAACKNFNHRTRHIHFVSNYLN